MLNEAMVPPVNPLSMVEFAVPTPLKATGVVATGTPLLQLVAVDQLPGLAATHKSPVALKEG